MPPDRPGADPSAPPTVRYGHRPLAAPADAPHEAEALRRIANALAAGRDSASLLQVLCNAAMEQGRGSGAMVAEVTGDTGRFSAATGVVEELAGMRFPLAGSVTERVVATRAPIAIHTVAESTPQFEALLGAREVGPVLVVPLVAHDTLLGVLSVTRRDETPPFDAADVERMRAVADLAALALQKARLLEEARAADAAKTALLAMLSHELRTPLAALEGYGELLEDEITGPLTDAQRDVVMRLRTVSRHLGGLIEEILTFASLEADRITLRPQPMRFEEVLDALHLYVEPLAREKGIAFRVACDPGIPVIASDEDRVRHILLNLCQNAVKFTEQGEVSVRVTRGSPDAAGRPTVRCAVRDTGIGIAEGDLPRLFRAFSQLDAGPTRRHRGTGLGLYICRRLAELLGGRMEVVSRPGEGSTFTLVLPAIAPGPGVTGITGEFAVPIRRTGEHPVVPSRAMTDTGEHRIGPVTGSPPPAAPPSPEAAPRTRH